MRGDKVEWTAEDGDAGAGQRSRGDLGPDTLRPIPFKRQALHAYRLRCQHPADGRTMTFEAPPPIFRRSVRTRHWSP
jgi:hypothetical protein